METSFGKKIGNAILILLFLLIIIAIFFIVVFKVSTYHIVGSSMNPTLVQDELVLSMTPRGDYHRGDIIAFETEEGITIKRVIGLPGEKVFIDKYGSVFINEKELKEEYLTTRVRGDIETPNPYTVPLNEYYVLGDNRGDSKDSRLLNVGSIKERNIQGRVFFSISNFKFLK